MTSIEKINELVQQELKEANEIHPQFASNHEAWAVIKEETEECTEALEHLQHYMQVMWRGIRADEDIDEWLTFTQRQAMNLAAEAIQVAAMCEKGLARYADAKNL